MLSVAIPDLPYSERAINILAEIEPLLTLKTQREVALTPSGSKEDFAGEECFVTVNQAGKRTLRNTF